MTIVKAITFFLLIVVSPIMDGGGSASAQIPQALRHDIEKAGELFQKRCTECHSMETALSSRAYRDWLTGISDRHGKGYDWIPEEEAKLVFLHLLVHLEPQVKATIEAKRFEPKENWKILICLITGFMTIALLSTTLIFGHSKRLRRMWFKGHSYFAITTFVSAIIHGGYCSYVFILK